MRKLLLILLLCSCLPLLCSCTEFNQVEDLAFAEILGVDIDETNRIEASIQISGISGARGEDGSGDSPSSPLIYSAGGETLDEALHLLQWKVPRRLDLSQLELIVISESLASDNRFLRTANTIMATPRLYTAARLAVCRGSVREFLTNEKPAIGTQISTELSAMFADYSRNGFIPDETFADVFYRTRSIYSDALAVHANTASQSQPASAMSPSEPSAAQSNPPQNNRFLGAVIFQDGLLHSRLNAEEYLFCKILRGEQQTFPYSADGQTVGLTTLGIPDIRIDTKKQPMQIDISLRFAIVSSSGSAPADRLEASLKREFTHIIKHCQQMHTDPFRFADIAAGAFPTFKKWEDFQWIDQFSASNVNLNIQVHDSKS